MVSAEPPGAHGFDLTRPTGPSMSLMGHTSRRRHSDRRKSSYTTPPRGASWRLVVGTIFTAVLTAPYIRCFSSYSCRLHAVFKWGIPGPRCPLIPASPIGHAKFPYLGNHASHGGATKPGNGLCGESRSVVELPGSSGFRVCRYPGPCLPWEFFYFCFRPLFRNPKKASIFACNIWGVLVLGHKSAPRKPEIHQGPQLRVTVDNVTFPGTLAR